MISQQMESQLTFLGWGESLKCANCSNEKPEGIYQLVTSQSLFYMEYAKTRGPIYSICPVCEKKTKIGMISGLMGSAANAEIVRRKLKIGQSLTKRYHFEILGEESRNDYLKLLNKNGLTDFVLFLTGHG